MLHNENENPFQRWAASQIEGHLDNGKVTKARTTLKPEKYTQYRNITQFDLIKDLETNMVTVKIHATAQAREKGLFNELSQKYEGKAKIVDENLTGKSNIKVPVLHITVPYTNVVDVLNSANSHEDKLCKMSEQTEKRLVDTISDSAVNYLINTFKQIFK